MSSWSTTPDFSILSMHYYNWTYSLPSWGLVHKTSTFLLFNESLTLLSSLLPSPEITWFTLLLQSELLNFVFFTLPVLSIPSSALVQTLSVLLGYCAGIKEHCMRKIIHIITNLLLPTSPALFVTSSNLPFQLYLSR